MVEGAGGVIVCRLHLRIDFIGLTEVVDRICWDTFGISHGLIHGAGQLFDPSGCTRAYDV